MSDMVRPIVGPNARLESAVESLHHRLFVITVRDGVVRPFALQESLHVVLQFLAVICLESSWHPGVGIVNELLESGEHLLSRLVLDWDSSGPRN